MNNDNETLSKLVLVQQTKDDFKEDIFFIYDINGNQGVWFRSFDNVDRFCKTFGYEQVSPNSHIAMVIRDNLRLRGYRV